MRRQAFDTLVAAGVNALVDAGMHLDAARVSAEQRVALGMTEEDGVTATFDLHGVPCVACSKPAGCGEERILILYNSDDRDKARRHVQCANVLNTYAQGVTAAKVTLERERGPYVMQTNLGKRAFRCTQADMTTLASHAVAPYGYALTGPFIF